NIGGVFFKNTCEKFTVTEYSFQQQVFIDKFGPSFPSLRSLLINSSFVFINSNELFELPRPVSHKMIYVGGIALPKRKELPEVYLKLFSKYSSAVLFSFGSLARTTLMPIEMKSAFINAFTKFPNILFIWKVDRGTANDSFYINARNVFAVEWTPQNDLLRSGHINAFITHAGLNSLSEAIFAGVSIIAIPLFGDQMYNAEIAKKRHIGYVINKWNVTENSIVDALKTILYDKRASFKMKRE
uniref:glucuronosyltransferase n=1 Tax=Ascaris lumbricoides TaxID=6252 RepID=A0A0M3IW82_ASCLU